jgi:hypothetical protein
VEKQAYLKTVSKVKPHEVSDTYELHLVLDTEHLMVLVLAGDGTIRKLNDLLEARDPRCITIMDLVGEGAMDVRRRGWKDARLVEVDADADIFTRADDGVDAALAAVVLVATSELR